jgi:hypothetical protein
MPLSEDTLSCLGTEVPLPKIDRALKELWDSDAAKTRASLINFAIYSEDPESLAGNNELLGKITAEHACRALLITCLPDARPQRARAWINALCRPYQGRQIVCSEQISLVLQGGVRPSRLGSAAHHLVAGRADKKFRGALLQPH